MRKTHVLCLSLVLICGVSMAEEQPDYSVPHAQADKEKCYGMKTPEKDNCAERREGMLCKRPDEEKYKHFQYVDKGTCEQLGDFGR